jgi:hypothetical protein
MRSAAAAVERQLQQLATYAYRITSELLGK